MLDQATELYQRVIMERSRSPHHAHDLPDADAAAHGDNPMCGDEVTVSIRLGADGRVADAAFQGRGCAISLASADVMADLARGRSASELQALFARFEHTLRPDGAHAAADDLALDALRPFTGVREYPSRVKCATLPWRALLSALDRAAAKGETPQ